MIIEKQEEKLKKIKEISEKPILKEGVFYKFKSEFIYSPDKKSHCRKEFLKYREVINYKNDITRNKNLINSYIKAGFKPYCARSAYKSEGSYKIEIFFKREDVYLSECLTFWTAKAFKEICLNLSYIKAYNGEGLQEQIKDLKRGNINHFEEINNIKREWLK
jgi:hypothetical protein